MIVQVVTEIHHTCERCGRKHSIGPIIGEHTPTVKLPAGWHEMYVPQPEQKPTDHAAYARDRKLLCFACVNDVRKCVDAVVPIRDLFAPKQ